MTTSYTPILKLALPVTGELTGTWGDVVNNNITSMVEQAIAGLATIDSWIANSHTLTTANGTTSESRCAILVLDDDGLGQPAGAATVICPAATKIYIVKNTCGQTATIKTAAGTGVAIPNNATGIVFCDGTNVVEGATYSGSVDINGGTIDGTTIGGTTPAAGSFTTANATTLDATNLEVTNLKAKDGTAAGSIADSTGVVTLASSVLTTTDINGGTIDGVTIGGASAGAVSATNLAYTGTLTGGTGVVNIGSGQVYKDASGNVGIGTSSPQGRLDVAVNGSVTSSIRSTTAGSTASPRVMKLSFFGVAGDGVTPQEKAFISSVDQTADISSSFLSFGTNNSGTTAERMRINSAGNMGIGTSSPGYKLDVRGGSIANINSAADAYYYVGEGLGTAEYASWRWDRTNNLTIFGTDAAAPIAFHTNNTERMRIDASGRLLVGSTTNNFGYKQEITGTNASAPFQALSLFNTSANQGAKIAFLDGAGNAAVGNLASSLIFYSGGASNETARIDSSGNLLLGTANDGAHFTISGAAGLAGAGMTIFETSSGNSKRLRIFQNATEVIYNATAGSGSNAHVWQIGNSETARITSDGNLLVGTTGLLSGMSGEFAVGNSRQIAIDSTNGNIKIRGNTSPWAMGTEFVGSSGTNRGGFGVLGSSDALTYYWVGTAYNGTGVALNYGSTSWSTLSDEREKNIYGVIENALDKILQFDGVYFNYKSDKPEQRRRVGFSAQKVQAAFPEAVDESQREIDNPTEETKRLTLSATEIIPLLVQAVKEQQALIQDLTTRLTTLEGN